MLDGFVCDNCGFASSEETGHTYYCPKCGNQMRHSRPGDMFGNNSDINTTKGVLAWDIMYLVFVGGLSFGVINYISYYSDDTLDIILLALWLVLFIVSLILFHRFLKNSVCNKAIKK